MRIFCLVLCLIVFSLKLIAAESELGTRTAAEALLQGVPLELQKALWYGTIASDDPKAPCGFEIKGGDGSIHSEGLSVFIGDINNDGKDEYVLVSRCGGSAATDTILEVFSKEGSSFTPLGFAKILQKNGLDGSKLPMNIGSPFLIKNGNRTLMNFRRPNKKWLWGDDKIEQFKK